jgi:hypothetical protein
MSEKLPGVLLPVLAFTLLLTVVAIAIQRTEAWIIQGGATLCGVLLALVFGIWQFDVQQEKIANRRRGELREGLIAELYATRDRLKTTEVITITAPKRGQTDIAVRLMGLEPTVYQEAIRSGLLGFDGTKNLTIPVAFDARIYEGSGPHSFIAMGTTNRSRAPDAALRRSEER